MAETCHHAHLSIHLEKTFPPTTAIHAQQIYLSQAGVWPVWASLQPWTYPSDLRLTTYPTRSAGAAAKATEERKIKANGGKCADLGWVCVPVVAESYGAWGMEAEDLFSKLASRIATSTLVGKSKSVVLYEIYGRLATHAHCQSQCYSNTVKVIPLVNEFQ